MKKTLIKEVEELLKTGWFSNFQMNMCLMSSSADRTMRRIRECPPSGYIMVQRPKKVPDGYGKCLEYKLSEVKDEVYY